MHIVPVPCLTDNYAYLVICEATRSAAVIDPSEVAPVEAALAEHGVELASILCTHHHPDHTAGVAGLLARHNGAPVYAHASEAQRIPELSRPLGDGDVFRVGELGARVMHVPAHTMGALAFVIDERAVFSGDTLFVAGCGRLFEGTPALLAQSLARFAGLPAETLIYPGHEYAEKNLRFASTVEPDNAATARRLEEVRAKRSVREMCVPSTVALELATNPFLRCDAVGVRAFAAARGARGDDAVAVLAAVRGARDEY